MGYKITKNDRKLIKPLELDIVFINKPIAIEFNGEYWHSSRPFRRNKIDFPEYHKNKFNMANEIGIILAFVWEDDWKSNKEKVKADLKIFIETNGEIIPNPFTRLLSNYDAVDGLQRKTTSGILREGNPLEMLKNRGVLTDD